MDSVADSLYGAGEDTVPPPDPGPDATSIADERIAACLDQQAPDLDLNGLGLLNLPEAVRTATWLRKLKLGNNRLRTLPGWIDSLSDLRELDLRGTPIEAFPQSFRRLTRLQFLLVTGNSSSSSPRVARNLGEVIQHINSLSALGLTYFGLSEMPEWIRQLRNLERLWLFSNSFASIPDWSSELSRLRLLSVRNNRLEALPESLRTLKFLTELHIEGNPELRIPQEIAESRNASKILSYYYRTAAPGAGRPLNEFKLIIVGRGAAGKTTLVERLVTDRFKPNVERTPGINITKWAIKIGDTDVRAHVWDFGGQEIMHGTHRFFMTERALYLVLITGRENTEDRDAEHWLSLVRSFAGDAPIIVVLHKWSDYGFTLNRGLLREKYGRNLVFTEVDSKTEHGVPELHERIRELAHGLPGLGAAWPAEWWRIKEQLPALKQSWLSYHDFCSFARDCGVTDPEGQESLAESLNDLGLMLYYSKDEALRNFGVLNPQWVTRGIYGMLTSQAMRQALGVFTVKSFGEVLDRHAYPERLHRYLVALMRKFLLCFPLDDRGERYLMPELLTKEEPDLEADFPANQCLWFIYRYDSVLPEGVLQHFIVRAYVHLETKHMWRTGVVLERARSRALVRGDVQSRQITIRVVGGDTPGRRELLAIIRSYFEDLHHTYQKLPVTELVPVQGYPHVQLEYGKLRAYELNRREMITEVIDGNVVDLPVKELLDGVDLPGVRSGAQRGAMWDQDSEPLSLVISYAQADEVFADQLNGVLVPYQRAGKVKVWSTQLITAGQQWESEIFANLDRAHIVVLLLSFDFLSSCHCMDRELARAAERHAKRECEIVPVIVRACVYKMMPYLERIQAIEPDGKPINSHTDKDQAWVEVTKQIDRVIERLKKK